MPSDHAAPVSVTRSCDFELQRVQRARIHHECRSSLVLHALVSEVIGPVMIHSSVIKGPFRAPHVALRPPVVAAVDHSRILQRGVLDFTCVLCLRFFAPTTAPSIRMRFTAVIIASSSMFNLTAKNPRVMRGGGQQDRHFFQDRIRLYHELHY